MNFLIELRERFDDVQNILSEDKDNKLKKNRKNEKRKEKRENEKMFCFNEQCVVRCQ